MPYLNNGTQYELKLGIALYTSGMTGSFLVMHFWCKASDLAQWNVSKRTALQMDILKCQQQKVFSGEMEPGP